MGSQTGSNEGSEDLERIIFDLPKRIRNDFSNSIRTLLIKNTSDDWLEKFGELKEYLLKENELGPPDNHPSLGNWVGTQRINFKRKRLTHKRTNLLNEINFIWNTLENQWHIKYLELKEYLLKENELGPPDNHPSLGSWVCSQRMKFKRNSLSKEKTNLLNEINFIWDSLENQWQLKYQELKEFKNQYGHSSPVKSNPSLGQWVQEQRLNYKKNKIPEERLLLLKEINFLWDPRQNEWQLKYQELKEFKNQYGHSSPVRSHPDLGNWVKVQRRRYKKKIMSPEEYQLLKNINFVFDPHSEVWNEKFHELQIFIEMNDNRMPRQDHPSLGTWVSNQRSKYKKNTLPLEKVQLLESLKGWVWKTSRFDLKKHMSEKRAQTPTPSTQND